MSVERVAKAFHIMPDLRGPQIVNVTNPIETREYALCAKVVDIPTMLENVSVALPKRQKSLLRKVISSSVWGENISLREISDFRNRFHRVTGAISLPEIPQDSPYNDFFIRERFHENGKVKSNRGVHYYVAIDPAVTPERKADVFLQDITAGLKVIKETDGRPTTPDELLLSLGVADYIKNAFITAYHALTYDERAGIQPTDKTYHKYRTILEKYSVLFTRRFFQASIGRPYDHNFNLKEISAETTEAFQYLRGRVMTPASYKLSEIDHPLIIMGNAYQNAEKYPDTNIIIGLPSGGSQSAIATQLAYEYIHGITPDLTFIPLSTHSARSSLKSIMDDGRLRAFARTLNLKDRNVLITDDTTNTGVTLARAYYALTAEGAGSVHASVCELDPIRIMVKQGRWKNPPATVANLEHPDFETAIDIVPVTRGKGEIAPDRQLRKLAAFSVLDAYYRENTPIIAEISLPQEVVSTSPINVKLCGVHNSADLAMALTNGISMIGIHAAYDDVEAYSHSLLKRGSALAAVENVRAKELNHSKRLPLPWAEYRAIRAMFEDIQTQNVDVTSVFLIRPKIPDEVAKILQTLLPKNFERKILVQIQSYYDAKFLNQIREDLDSQGFNNIHLIQTIGMDDPEAGEKVLTINTDNNVDFVLFDSSQRGGTGEQRSIAEISTIATLTQKPIFLAGGLNPENIASTLADLHQLGIQLFGVDVESGLEHPKSAQSMGVYKYKHNPVVTVRKDEEKIRDFMRNITDAC
jgi:phosphoribosylanthranilate isomerase